MWTNGGEKVSRRETKSIFQTGRVRDQESVVALKWSGARPGERIVTQERGLQLRRASAGAVQDDAGLGGLSGRVKSRRGSDTAVQEGVTKTVPFHRCRKSSQVMRA